MIDVQGLEKRFPEKKDGAAVDGVSFTCRDGRVTGLLGPNAAGKTTTMRLIVGLMRPDRGSVVVDGHDVSRNPGAARARMGFQSSSAGLYPFLSPREHFRYYGRFYGLHGRELETRIEQVVADLDLGDVADRRCKGFSTGQVQRIALGRALLHSPHNVILDEPTNGLDVVATKDMCDTIRWMRERGHCVLLATHQMKEAELLCDDVAVIVKGRIVAFGTQQELVARSGKKDLQAALVGFARAR